MNIRDRFRYAARAWRLGPAVVDQFLMAMGADTSRFGPEEYGNYLATSGAVYTCSTMRAQALASLPIRVIRGDKERTDGNLYKLLQSVNKFWTRARLIEMTELSLCAWGVSYWTLERGETGTQVPTEIWWAKPDRMTPFPDPEKYITKFEYAGGGSRPIVYTPGEVFWLRYPNPLDEYSGLSPLAAARLAADVASAGAKSNRDIYDNALGPGAIVTPKREGSIWTKEQMQEQRDLLESQLKGTGKRHKTLVMREAISIDTPVMSPKDAEFLGALKWSLEEVCRAYKVPLDLVGGQRTYDNYASALKAFWSQCIEPEARFIADELTEQLIPMFPGEADRVEFDLSNIAVLQEAEGERWTRAQTQIASGALLINEWREAEGLAKVAWGDVWWGPSSVTPIDSAEKPQTATPPSQFTEGIEPLRSRKWKMPKRISISGLRDVGGAKKNKTERELAEDVAIILALMAARVKASLGDPPDIDNVPASVWSEFERRLRDAIRPALERVGEAVLEDAIDEAGIDPDGEAAGEVADDLDDWASSHASEEAAQLIQTTKEKAGAGLTAWAEAGSEGSAWDSISSWFEDGRAGGIASDDVTDAALMAVLLLGKQTRSERTWHTMQDEAVCGLCGPLDGLRESEWPEEIDGRAFEGERLHDHCRCWTTLERV